MATYTSSNPVILAFITTVLSIFSKCNSPGASGCSAVNSPVSIPLVQDGGFWFGSFDVGQGRNLSLLIDTGSSDVGVNPDAYKPSDLSISQNKSDHLQYGTTSSDGCNLGDIAFNAYSDSMSVAGLSVSQTFAWVQDTDPPNNFTITKFPRDGLVGFSSSVYSLLKAPTFFESLCKRLPQCRFGISLRTDGTGTQKFGGVDDNAFDDTLSIVKSVDKYGRWEFVADVVADGAIISRDQSILLDSGTVNVIGPVDQVEALFKATGLQHTTELKVGCAKFTTASYPCDKAPKIGFTFANSTATWDIDTMAFAASRNSDGSCTSTVTGIDIGKNFWILGQSWMQQKYIDFNVAEKQIGIANLK